MNYVERLWITQGHYPREYRVGVEGKYKPFLRGQPNIPTTIGRVGVDEISHLQTLKWKEKLDGMIIEGELKEIVDRIDIGF